MPATRICRCPSCRAPMTAQGFARKTGGEVELDLCFACQGIWFDEHESLHLAPAGVIGLFKLIHEHRDDLSLALASPLRCPRCSERLLHVQDRVKSGLFNYMSCARHGRFVSFSQFMIEKGFVRQLSGAELDQLKVRIGAVRCTGCGAAVDIRRESACSHCRAPIAILDTQAVEQALAGYQQAAARQAAAPEPALLAEAILVREHERSRYQHQRSSLLEADVGDLLLDGIAMVGDMLW
ncbi:MAG: zf-TFIIB domain-containing protein [Betaproteobacteria bacterium]|nr:zf-TFIIB domain-containing protein [Rhodocyclales bacterium]